MGGAKTGLQPKAYAHLYQHSIIKQLTYTWSATYDTAEFTVWADDEQWAACPQIAKLFDEDIMERPQEVALCHKAGNTPQTRALHLFDLPKVSALDVAAALGVKTKWQGMQIGEIVDHPGRLHIAYRVGTRRSKAVLVAVGRTHDEIARHHVGRKGFRNDSSRDVETSFDDFPELMRDVATAYQAEVECRQQAEQSVTEDGRGNMGNMEDDIECLRVTAPGTASEHCGKRNRIGSPDNRPTVLAPQAAESEPHGDGPAKTHSFGSTNQIPRTGGLLTTTATTSTDASTITMLSSATSSSGDSTMADASPAG